jgi:hypothetical protein
VSTLWGGSLALLSLCAGLLLVAAAVLRPDDRQAQLAHGVMGLAMGGMFSPLGDPVPAPLGLLTFAVIAAWFAARVLRRQPPVQQAGHVVVASVAMVLMYLTQHGSAAAGSAGGGHAGHAAAAAAHVGEGGGSPVAMVLALALTGYFVWHAWDSGIRSGIRRSTRPSTARTEPAAHVVLSGLMALMCLGAV